MALTIKAKFTPNLSPPSRALRIAAIAADLAAFLEYQGALALGADGGKAVLGGGHEGFEQFAQLGGQVEHVAAGAVELLDDLVHGDLVAQGQGDQPAGGGPHGGFVLEVHPVVKGELGKDLHRFFVLVETDNKIDGLLVDVLEPVALGAEDIGQGRFLEQAVARGQGGLVRAGGHGVEHLMVAAAVAVDGQSLAAQFIAQQVGGADILGAGVGRQVDGLADRGIDAAALEGALHADMLFRADILGGTKNILPKHRDFGMTDDRAAAGDPLQ